MPPARDVDPVPWPVGLAAASFLCAWAFFVRYRFLTEVPVPLGVDGYFYPVQLRSILESGGLAYPSAPLGLYLLAPLAAAAGPIAGAKLGAALASALLVLPAYALGRRLGGERSAGLLAAAVIASSPASFYLATEFVKNVIGLAIAGAALWLLARAFEVPGRARSLAAASAFAALFLTHKLAFALALWAALPPLVPYLRGQEPAARRRLGLGLGAAGLAVALAGAFVPGLPGPADLSLALELVRSEADLSLPVLDLGGRPLGFRGEVPIAAALGAGALWALARGRRPGGAASPREVRALVLGPALFALGAALPWLDVGDPQGPAFRLRLCVFFAAALCAPLCGAAALARLSPRGRALALTGAAALLCLLRPARYEEPVVRPHPAMIRAVQNLAGRVPEGGVVIVPERHILFMVAWYARTPARLRPEPVERSRRYRLLPRAHISPELARALDRARREAPADLAPPASLHPLHPDGLVLIPEPTWAWILERLPPAARDRHRRWTTI